ncbi:tetratricopeptide repeat protein [Micromonospora sp. RL09-050-HVF-A]|uniref:tetratricopeptide repeat protein n=1 Tax=Micromonospora sp. RL09-050-HVF-A TaxID=1703433 RepID=UPI00210538E0|nr:tetratricopeptide repeat protein [Micromonospora sp. RL09-050-HVF-A]
MSVRRRLRQIVLLFSSVAVVVPVVYFLVKQGLDRAEKITSIGFGLLGAVGLVVGWRTARPGKKPGTASPTESVPLGCLLHLRDDGRPPLVEQVDPLDLGVKPAIDTTDRHDQDLPRYVPRTGDDDLEWAIAEGGIVLLHGKAAAGKSRSAFEAIHRLRPHHQLLTPAYAGALRDLVEAGYPISDAVVWLDDLERFLTPGGIDQALLQRLCPSGRADVVVVATIRDEELSRLDHAATRGGQGQELITAGLDEAAAKLVAQIRGRRRIPVGQHLTDSERTAAEATGDDRITAALTAGVGFAEYLAAGPAMMRRWSVGDGPSFEVGHALISAAVDCRRAGYTTPVSRDILAKLYRPYLSPAWRHRADLPTITQGLQWACERVLGASSCLLPHDNDTYTASDYLLDRTTTGQGPLAATPVPDHVWNTLLPIATTPQAATIGTHAYFTQRLDIAEQAWRTAADTGHTDAMFNLGVLLARGGDSQEEAEQWFRHAADTGHTDAMSNLGVLLEQRGSQEEAEQWFRRAADTGHTEAMYNLGVLLEQRGSQEEAEQWFRRAADTGDTRAMSNLGVLLEQRGSQDEAEQWYRRAADTGHTEAMSNLGVLLEQRGSQDEAEQWYRRAADTGHTRAMSNLGVLLAKRGDSQEEAEQWFRRAADTGHTDAMNNLGILLKQRGDSQEEAEQWYRRAADTGHTDAMYNLGILLEQRGSQDEAEQWYRRAAGTGHRPAMSNLRALLEQRGDGEQPEG